jgi:tetratricopeptide (TPR) repeat protein
MRRNMRFLKRTKRKAPMTPFEMNEHAHALALEDRFAEAIEIGTAALTGLRGELGDEDPNVTVAITNLASYYAGAQRWSEALPFYQEGLARKVRQYGEDHPSCANTLVRMARCHAGLGEVDAAMSAYRRALAIFDRHPESDAAMRRIVISELAGLAGEAGHRDEVRDLSRQLARLAARQLLESRDASWEETLQEAGAACLWHEQAVDGLMEAIRDGAGPADGILLLRHLADWLIGRRRSTSPAITDFASRKGPWESAFAHASAQLEAGDAVGARKGGLKAAEVGRELFGQRSIEVALSLNLLAVAYQRLGDDQEALTRYSEALAAAEGAVGPNDGLLVALIDNVATSLGRLQRHAEAKEHLARIVAIGRAQVPIDPSALAIALCDLADAAEEVDDLEGAVRAAVEAREVVAPDDALRFAVEIKARCFELLFAAEPGNYERAHQLLEQGRLREAVPAFRRLLALRLWTVGPSDLSAVAEQNTLGGVLLKLGRFAEAESLLTDAHRTLVAAPSASAAHLVAVAGHLAILRRRLGQFEQAEQLHETTVELARQVDARSREYGLAMVNAGAFFRDVGRYDRARTLYEQAQPILAEVLGTRHPDYILLLSNLGHLELDFGNAARAVELLNEACSTGRSSLGEQHEYYLSALNNLGYAQRALGQDDEALATLERALTLKQEAFGPDNVDLAVTLTALAELHEECGRPDLAETLFERSLKLRRSAYGDRHPSVARAHGMLAQHAWRAGRFDKARAEFSAALSLHRQQLIELLPGMAEEDRASYWQEVSLLFDVFTAFALSDTVRHPQTAGELYDLQLFRKALLLHCVVSMRAAAAASGEQHTRGLYEDWLAAKRLLASALLSENGAASAVDIEQLSARATKLEKELAGHVGRDVIMARVGEVGWRDVRDTLMPSEGAIEIVRSPLSGFPSPVEPSYAALVLRGDATGPPQVVTLGSATALEGPALESYLDHRETIWPGSYDDYWRPLRSTLAGVTRAHLAPDGIYNRLDVNILFSSDEHAFLGDALDLRVVTSSRDLLGERMPPPGQRTAALFGRPAYTAPVHGDGEPGAPIFFDLEAPPHFSDLPGTEPEVLDIAAVLDRHGWRVERFIGEAASKTAIQQLVGPRVLHVATHGFYVEVQQTIFSNPTRGAFTMVGPLEEDAPGAKAFFQVLAEEGFSRRTAPVVRQRAGNQMGIRVLDPLFRAGLALAGASGGPSGTADQTGILTAYEAAALDLHGTELVVLSTCDSALGELRAGEGTFGLMRALRAAGARCVLGAVWPMDDTIAREFVTTFYRSWVEHGDAERALQDTRQTMRSIYRLPLFWGGFVLVV